MKNIKSYNNKGEPHGCWEIYYPNGKLMYKGHLVNGKPVGYWKWYRDNGKIELKEFYI